jgi:hypothetical protein
MHMNIKICYKVAAFCSLLAISACDLSTPPPTKSADKKSEIKPNVDQRADQSAKARVDLAKTRDLYDKISKQQLGEVHGTIQWVDGAGILLHPGSTPTEASFDVSGMPSVADLVFWINDLPPDALADPRAGTAAVEVFLDGVSQGRKKVDRQTKESLSLNFNGTSTLRAVVDNSDGTDLCDWFFMGVR